MEKRNYTHIQELLPQIKAMLVEGKTQREVAEHYGFKDKYVVKQLPDRKFILQQKEFFSLHHRHKPSFEPLA